MRGIDVLRNHPFSLFSFDKLSFLFLINLSCYIHYLEEFSTSGKKRVPNNDNLSGAKTKNPKLDADCERVHFTVKEEARKKYKLRWTRPSAVVDESGETDGEMSEDDYRPAEFEEKWTSDESSSSKIPIETKKKVSFKCAV